jgi:hypothetical protein
MLSAAVDAYLTSRRAAGFQLHDHEGILRDFARFASAVGDVVVRTRTVLEWVRSPRREPAAARRPAPDRRPLRSVPPGGGRAP